MRSHIERTLDTNAFLSHLHTHISPRTKLSPVAVEMLSIVKEHMVTTPVDHIVWPALEAYSNPHIQHIATRAAQEGLFDWLRGGITKAEQEIFDTLKEAVTSYDKILKRIESERVKLQRHRSLHGFKYKNKAMETEPVQQGDLGGVFFPTVAFGDGKTLKPQNVIKVLDSHISLTCKINEGLIKPLFILLKDAEMMEVNALSKQFFHGLWLGVNGVSHTESSVEYNGLVFKAGGVLIAENDVVKFKVGPDQGELLNDDDYLDYLNIDITRLSQSDIEKAVSQVTTLLAMQSTLLKSHLELDKLGPAYKAFLTNTKGHRTPAISQFVVSATHGVLKMVENLLFDNAHAVWNTLGYVNGCLGVDEESGNISTEGFVDTMKNWIKSLLPKPVSRIWEGYERDIKDLETGFPRFQKSITWIEEGLKRVANEPDIKDILKESDLDEDGHSWKYGISGKNFYKMFILFEKDGRVEPRHFTELLDIHEKFLTDFHQRVIPEAIKRCQENDVDPSQTLSSLFHGSSSARLGPFLGDSYFVVKSSEQGFQAEYENNFDIDFTGKEAIPIPTKSDCSQLLSKITSGFALAEDFIQDREWVTQLKQLHHASKDDRVRSLTEVVVTIELQILRDLIATAYWCGAWLELRVNAYENRNDDDNEE